jgi:tRNA threonylcarbamoyladenosine biosynthesis protein TsaB
MLVARQRHAEVLMPAIDQLCRQAGWSVADLTAVAVDRGPGLFTGLRVGLATAYAIAGARGIPAVGLTSLDVLAHPHRRRAGLVASVIDARRGEVYWALYGADGMKVRELRPPMVATPEALAIEFGGLDDPVLAVGDGASRYEALFTKAGVTVGADGETWPSALAVAELAAHHLGEGGTSGGFPAPLYLRQADVRIGWDQVDGRVNGQSADEAADKPANTAADTAGDQSSVNCWPVTGTAVPGPEAATRSARDGAAAASSPRSPKLAP